MLESLEPRFPLSPPSQPEAVEKASRPEPKGERAIYVKGWGAFGHFECCRSMADVTMLPFLQREGQRTSTASRFSLAASSNSTPDASRNIWGFSTRFYTERGIFDLLCNHLPVFSAREGMNYLESVRALCPAPGRPFVDSTAFWNSMAQAPEATHFITWLYSDVGTVKNLRHLRTYGFDTHVWRNEAGEGWYVRYHWIPLFGTEYITAQESAALAEDPDVAGRDLRTAIAGGYGPEYELQVQLMKMEDGQYLDYDPLDCTKVWREKDHPRLLVGRLTLEENPEKDEVERLSFSPVNLLTGVEHSGAEWLQVHPFPDWSGQLRGEQSDFVQAGEHYRLLSPWQRSHLTDNLATALSPMPAKMRETVLSYLGQADEEYRTQVAGKMKLREEG